jgi:hypothetical protein
MIKMANLFSEAQCELGKKNITAQTHSITIVKGAGAFPEFETFFLIFFIR